jgi:D-sedoheptulose 7-phosphate isomerase
MSVEFVEQSLREAQSGLVSLLADAQTLEVINRVGTHISEVLDRGGRVFSCGNGGSMCDAMHFAEELTGRFRNDRRGLAATAISDPGFLSCAANDFGYERVFERYLQAHAQAGDVVVAFSTSGNSANIVRAAQWSKEHGVTVVGLTGKIDSKLPSLCDYVINTPSGKFADRVQELHIKVVHILIELIERRLFPENYPG